MQPGIAQELEPGLRRIVAPNPSALTGTGTNTWILGRGEVVVIDPGPDDPAHLAALATALSGEQVAAILLTHAHRDHAGLARALADATGAEIHAYGPPAAGMSPVMKALAAQGGMGGGEGIQADFVPDVTIGDGAIVTVAGLDIRAIHTPGHMGGHLCFALGNALFSGDHVMGWATSLVSPPQGDMGAYVASLKRLAGAKWRIFYPGHGEPVAAPDQRLAELITHRAKREASILAVLSAGPATPAGMVAQIYTDTPVALHPAASRNVFAHLIDLVERNLVSATPDLSPVATYARL
ncbi:MAG: MBL fold metallo-hydrolase [Paracoccaceae bacterium]